MEEARENSAPESTGSATAVSHGANNRRIARNTLFLAFRMLLIMGISIYTSRVIIDVLGEQDYGLYTLIAGIIVLFSFLSNALLTSCQRFLSIAVGAADNHKMQQTFTTAVILHVLIAIVIALITEGVGLWVVHERLYDLLKIPADRIDAAITVFQLMVLAMITQIVRIPYTAAVIAHERMDLFAYTGMVEAVLKLAIVYLLCLGGFDKLIYYSWLVVGVNVVILLWFMAIARFGLARYRLRRGGSRSMARNMLSFTGWNLLEGFADVGYKQGSSIILNSFFGLALNATLGLVTQMRTAIWSFTVNLQTAATPQIIKRFSAGDTEGYTTLVYSICKFSTMIIMAIAFPLIVNIGFVLDLWLIKIPPYCQSFCCLMLAYCIIDALQSPLWIAMEATGKIKLSQILTSITLLLNLPLMLLAFRQGMSPNALWLIQICVCFLLLYVRMSCLRPMSPLRWGPFLSRVCRPLVWVLLVGLAAMAATAWLFPPGWTRLLIGGTGTFLLIAAASVTLGCTRAERAIIFGRVRKLLARFRH